MPGATGFWNVVTLLLINLSLLAVLATLLAIAGFLKYDCLVRRAKLINGVLTFPLNFTFNEFGITLLTIGEKNDEDPKTAVHLRI